MTINLEIVESSIREERLLSLSGFDGTIGEIADGAVSCSLKNRKRCFSQNSTCMSGCAQGYLSCILDAAIVNHAPIGCAADSMGANNARKWGEFFQGISHSDVAIFNTNMTQQDAVFGALQKLRDTVMEAYRIKKPSAIFITTSCISAIIGEDVNSTARELQLELNIPVIPVACEGFKSKVWASGFDAAFHAILTGLTKPPQKKTNIVNVVNFRASQKKQLEDFFGRFGLKPLFIAGYCTVEQLSRLSESAATVSICGTLGTYIGNGLEQLYGVPYVKSLQPHGIAGFEVWLRHLGSAIGAEQAVERYIAEESEKALSEINEIRSRLKGTRAVVGMGPSFTFNFIRVLRELGIDVVWGSAWHLDQKYDHDAVPESIGCLAAESPDLRISISDHQYYEVVNSLRELQPDIYFYRHPSNASLPMKLGIPAISIIDEYTAFGYDGLINFGHTILDVLKNRNFEQNLSRHTRLPYSQWWLNSSRTEFLKEEV